MEKITGHDSEEMIHNDYYTKIFALFHEQAATDSSGFKSRVNK